MTHVILLHNPAFMADIADLSELSYLAFRSLFFTLVRHWQRGVLQFPSILTLPRVSARSHKLTAKSSTRFPLQVLGATHTSDQPATNLWVLMTSSGSVIC